MSSRRSPARTPSSSNRTVSTSGTAPGGRAVQADAVLLHRLHGRVATRPAVDDALAAAGADRGAQVVLLEGPAQLDGQRLAVARRHVHGAGAVPADDLG